MNSNNQKAVFLDRDGTINVEKNYIKSPEEIQLIPGSSDAIAMFNRAGYLVFGITNQSGVARGYFKVEDVLKVNARVSELVSGEGGEIKEIFFCPHHTEGKIPEYTIKCECRKPGKGMIISAAEKYSLDLDGMIVIGDKICDVELGYRMNAKTAMVGTGYGNEEYKALLASGSRLPDVYAKDLLEAAKTFLGQKPGE
ncbi:MAG: HAD family hydrolase [Nitrospinota bacterium]|nr:HAD family hydrolase [Nitrospinota bacterium]